MTGIAIQPTLVSPDRCEYEALGLQVIIDWINPHSKGIDAWCEIRWKPDNYLLAFGRKDLMAPATYTTLAKLAHDELSVDLPLEDVREIIKRATYNVIQLTRLGKETVRLDQVKPSSKRWLLPGILESGAHTRLIAPGGSFKSLFALAASVTVATGTPKLLGIRPTNVGPVLYLDWEADAETHAERLLALCKGAGIGLPDNIHYEHHDAPLAREAHALAGKIAELKPLMVIVDSAAMARGPSGEGGAEDTTLRMFQALRTFGCPCLIVDHKDKESIRRGIRGGYGSVFATNLARNELETVRMQNGGDTTLVAMEATKSNNAKKGRAFGFRFTIHEGAEGIWDSAIVEAIDPDEVQQAGGGEGQSHADRIELFLMMQTEAQTVAQIAKGCGYNEKQLGTVRTTLDRYVAIFENTTPGKGKEGHWRLRNAPTDDGSADPLIDPL